MMLNKKRSSHDLLSMGRMTQEQQMKLQSSNSEEDNNDGYVILTIDALSVNHQSHDEGQIVAVRYSKVKGSTKVFKLAKGWIQMILKSPSTDMRSVTAKSSYDCVSQHAQYTTATSNTTTTSIH